MTSREKNVCPICGGTGFIITPRGAKKCRCVYENFNISKYLHIPKRYWDADIRGVRDILDKENLEILKGYVKDFPTFYKKGMGLFLVGPQGVGKTYIAAALLKYLYKKYALRGLFIDTKELSIKFRDSFSEQKAKGGIVEALVKVPLLVLDDFGNETLTDWYRDILTALLTRRYNEKKVTIITTNYYPSYLAVVNESRSDYKPGQTLPGGVPVVERNAPQARTPKKVVLTSEDFLLDKRFGSHIVSRIGEMTIPIIVKGGDKRIQTIVL